MRSKGRAYSHQGHGPRADQQAGYISATSDSTTSLAKGSRSIHKGDIQMSLRLIRLPEVRNRCGYSSMHIWRLERTGRFPRRVKLGVNSVAWVEAEITAWCEARIAERDVRNR